MKGKKKGNLNVRRLYTQQVLSGYEHFVQPRNENGNSEKVERSSAVEKIERGKGSYIVYVPVIINAAGDDSNKHEYQISINDNSNVAISAYSQRSKKATGQVHNLPKEKGGKVSKISMVYGISENGIGTLSPINERQVLRDVASIYSWLLVQVGRAIQCTILQPENEKTNDDTGKRVQGTQAQEIVRDDKKGRRRKKVLSQVLPENSSKETAVLVETDRQILGRGQGDIELRSLHLGSVFDNREGIADILERGETPDIGF